MLRGFSLGVGLGFGGRGGLWLGASAWSSFTGSQEVAPRAASASKLGTINLTCATLAMKFHINHNPSKPSNFALKTLKLRGRLKQNRSRLHNRIRLGSASHLAREVPEGQQYTNIINNSSLLALPAILLFCCSRSLRFRAWPAQQPITMTKATA